VTEGVVIVVARAGRYLVIRRAAHILAGNAWCFVGGALEPGETQEQAAIREFLEEVGGHIHPLAKVWEYHSPARHLRLHWWQARLLNDELTANPAEVAELRWCTPAELAQLPDLLESNRTFLRTIGLRLLEDRPHP
jgi:mutator protein MutT